MRNKSFLSSIFHPFVCRTNRTGYLQFIQFFNRSFPAGDAPLGETSKSPLHFADYRGKSVISSYYISAPRPQARSVEQPPQAVPIASTASAVRVQTASTNTPCQCAKRKFYPLVPRPPPERWHGCGYCCRIECTVGEAGVRAARAHHLHAGFIDRKNLFQKNHGRFFKSRVGIHQHMGGLVFLLFRPGCNGCYDQCRRMTVSNVVLQNHHRTFSALFRADMRLHVCIPAVHRYLQPCRRAAKNATYFLL